MKILFTRSNKVVSRLIRWVTKEPVSHCAIQVDDWVVHSNFTGVNPVRLSKFSEGVEVWGEIEIISDYKLMFHKTCEGWGHHYDFGAMLYLAARKICPWLPKKNLWQTSGMYICSEWVSHVVTEEVDSMITPYKLFWKLKNG